MELYSNVLLGVPDEVIASVDDLNNGWHTNKFGGTPVSNIRLCRRMSIIIVIKIIVNICAFVATQTMQHRPCTISLATPDKING